MSNLLNLGTSEQKKQLNKLKHDLEDWREVILHGSRILTWEKAFYPGIIFAAASVLFLLLWFLDLSVLTLISLGLLWLNLLDYLYPFVGKILFKPENWTGVQEKEFEMICVKIFHAKQCICSIAGSLITAKEKKSTLFEASKMARIIKQRATLQQKSDLLDYLEQNLDIVHYEWSWTNTAEHARVNLKWLDIAELLNALGGSHKDHLEWKRYFQDWRKRIFYKVADLKKKLRLQDCDTAEKLSTHFFDLDLRMFNLVYRDESEETDRHEIIIEPPNTNLRGARALKRKSSESPKASLDGWISSEQEQDFDNEVKPEIESTHRLKPAKLLAKASTLKPTEGQDDEDSEWLREMSTLKTTKVHIMQRLQAIEEKKLELAVQKETREEKIFRLMLKKDQRESEEHKLKMEILRAKLAVLKQQFLLAVSGILLFSAWIGSAIDNLLLTYLATLLVLYYPGLCKIGVIAKVKDILGGFLPLNTTSNAKSD
ncbi:hypothetical protein DMENIID0001_009760 [Sergentomyia squamirostris]